MSEVEQMSLEDLQAKMQRVPTPEEAEKIKKNIEVFENEFGKISIENGLEFMMNLRKEANRQRAMRACKNFELQSRKIQHVPYTPHEAAERRLADTFQITEEFEEDCDLELIEDDE